MKLAIQTLIFSLVGTAICIGQEAPTGFAWLKQFEGSWTAISKSPDSGDDASTQQAIIESRAVGNLWIVNEYSGQVGGVKFEAVQTIGYDSGKKQFTGSWIDSMMNHTWHYSGSLDETGNKLMLEAEGPDWTDPEKSRKYRDVYEVKSENEITALSQILNDKGEWETFITSTLTKHAKPKNQTTVTPFLMFDGQAEEAINFYNTVFPDTQVESLTKYQAGENGKQGSVKLATIAIAGQRVKFIDSPVKPDFTFNPSFSFFVECENEDQLQQRFAKLSDGGNVMMPIGSYGFSQKFAWVSDKFGVSWQLNLK